MAWLATAAPEDRRGEMLGTALGASVGGALFGPVVGGAAYMTVHAQATKVALDLLPPTWQVGLVLMNREPAYLRVNEANLAQALHLLNSDEVQGKVTRAGGRADTLANVKDTRTDEEKVTEE